MPHHVQAGLRAGTALAALLIASIPLPGHAHDTGAAHAGAPTRVAAPTYGETATGVPLFDNLGSHSYPVSTRIVLAQAYFDQGLRLAWAFNHAEARRSFQAAQELDPSCAMCFWGEAFVLGPNINAGMAPDAVVPARQAIERALALAGNASPRERGLIAALAERYSADPQADRAALDQAYADAMGELAARFPEDDEIASLYADALMNLSPWDYWRDGGVTPKPDTVRLLASLEGVLARNPDHVGAIHLYIHAVEASTRPERAEPYTDRLAQLMPGAGHIVHMPAHIYVRVGRWLDSLESNRKAVAADEAYFARIGVTPDRQDPTPYTDGYYPHNVHFLLTSAQMAGDMAAIRWAADKLETLVSAELAGKVAALQAIKAAPYFAHAQFSDPAAILDLPAPQGGLPYVTATWHYARGVAYAALGERERTDAEIAALRRIAAETDFSAEEAGGLPARDLVELAVHIVEARLAQAGGDLAGARDRFAAAAAIEDGLAYMEPAYWYYPVRQSLGAVLLAMGDLEGAEAAFQQVLKQTPNNGWALWGLREVCRRTGDTGKAEQAQARFAAAWAGDPEFLTLDRL